MAAAIVPEEYPIVLKLEPNSELGLDPSNISIDLDNSNISIFNDRGGELTKYEIEDEIRRNKDNDNLFKDDSSLIIGYIWKTNDSRFNPQNYYTFEFLVSINCEMSYSDGTTHTNNFKLSYRLNKSLESKGNIIL